MNTGNPPSIVPAGRRPRVGLLFDTLWDDFEARLWRGVVDEARAQDVDLLCFAVGSVGSPNSANANRAVLYDLIGPHNVDGLLAISGCIGAFLGLDQLREHLRRFNDMPLICLSTNFDDLPCALVDNHRGMYDLTVHFITQHARKRIAFITGPETNFDSCERFDAYRAALADHGIAFDPQLVFTGNFAHESGGRGALELVKKRKQDFDALIAANDNMALDAMRVLRELGIAVPEQVLVGGFDDCADARSVRPSLTTVRQPTYGLGRQAVADMVKWLRTGERAQTSKLPARVVVRGSCGCLQSHAGASAGSGKAPARATRADELVAPLTQALAERFIIVTDMLDGNAWAKRLIESCIAEYKGESGALRAALEEVVTAAESRPIDSGVWGEVLHFLFGLLDVRLPIGAGARDSAFLYINQYTEMRQIAGAAAYAVEAAMLQRFQQPISASFDSESLNSIVRDTLPRLNIGGCWLSLYTDTERTTRGDCRALLAFERRAVDEIDSQAYAFDDAPHFAARELLLPRASVDGRARHLNVFPLFFEQEQFGLAVFQIDSLSAPLYEMLINNLTALIKSARLIEETRRYTEKLEQDVSARTIELRQANDELMEKHREIEKLNAELVEKNKIDVLTELYNRGALYEYLRMELNRTRRNRMRDRGELGGGERRGTGDHQTFSVMMCDLDHFKRINDTYGHLAGDEVLKAVGELLKHAQVLRQEDVAGRFGGEEFIVVLTNTDADNARYPANRFVSQLKSIEFTADSGQKFHVTVSVGISQYQDSDKGEEDVVRRADHALYFAKTHGRDQVVVYEMLPPQDRRVADDLADA